MQTGLPVGIILPYGGLMDNQQLSEEWLPCDGRLISREEYKDLYMAVRGAFGEEGTSFNLPDLRGRFLRGISGESDRDPDKDAREAMNPGGQVGNKLGSVQEDTAHYQYPKREKLMWHWDDTQKEVTLPDEGTSDAMLVHRGEGFGAWAGIKIQSRIKKLNKETRPQNANLNFIIKVL